MDIQTIGTLKVICFIAWSLVAFLAAVSYFADEHIEENYPWIKNRIADIWLFVAETNYKDFPKRSIQWFLSIINRLNYFKLLLFVKTKSALIRLPYLIYLYIFSTLYFYYPSKNLIISLIFILLIMSFALFFKKSKLTLTAYSFLNLTSIQGYMIHALGQNLTITTILMFLFIPFGFISAAMIFSHFDSSKGKEMHLDWANHAVIHTKAFPFIIGMLLSFVISSFSFLFGVFIENSYLEPLTLQLLLVNALMDGLTLYFTHSILLWAFKSHLKRIPVAILIDLVIGAILAVLSLYLGLFGTSNSFSFAQALNVLFGIDPISRNFSLGPYFWLMHTTFIPTLVYLAFVAFAWFLKITLYPISFLLEKIGDHKNPLKYTASLLGIFVVIFGISWKALGEWEKTVKEKTKIEFPNDPK